MKKSLFLIGIIMGSLFFLPAKSLAQCSNLNFSMNNFSYWQCYADTNLNGIDTIIPCSPIPGRHTIMDANLFPIYLYDEQCNVIPKVPIGFNYSAKLGNSNKGTEIDALEYTLTVDNNNSLLILHFAWVMENLGHLPADQPRFRMIIKDSLDRPLDSNIYKCSYVEFIADTGLQDLVCTGGIVARNWTTVGFSLEQFIGQKIKIYFETRDCTCGNHFGYAYIVGECRPMTTELMYCKGISVARLRAPDGFARYKWTRSGQPSWLHEGAGSNFQNIVLSDPADGEEFMCEVTSELGDECTAILRTVIERTIINAAFAFGVMENNEVDIVGHDTINWYDTCARTATFVDLSSIKNSTKESILWEVVKNGGTMAVSSDSLFTYTFPDSDTDQSVEYLIRLTVYAENGCTDTSSQCITIYPSFVIDSVHVNSIHPYFTLPQKTYCNNTNITFTNKSNADVLFFAGLDCRTDTNTYLTCEWDWGDGTESTQRFVNGTESTIEHRYNFSGTVTEAIVTLKVKIDNTSFEAIYTDTITLFPHPVAAFTDNGHEFSCPVVAGGANGRTVKFTNQSQDKIMRLIWNFGDTASGDNNEIRGNIDNHQVVSPAHTYNNAGKYDVLLVVEDSNGCVDSILKAGHVNILGPRGSVSYTESWDCRPLVVNFRGVFNEHEPGYLPDSLVIYTDDGYRMINSGSYLNLTRSKRHVYQFAGAYSPTYFLYKTVSFEGNIETCIVEIKEKDTVYVVDLLPDFDTVSLYNSGLPVTFNNTSSRIPSYLPYDSIAWDFGNGDISQDYDGRIIYDSVGTYKVKLTMKVLRCIKTDSVNIQVVKDPGNHIIPNKTFNNVYINVYPNPTTEQLRITNYETKFGGSQLQYEDIEIYDILGRRQQVTSYKQNEEIIIDISHLPVGIYVVKIETEIGIIMKEIIKE